jgi:Protein of unknown function DUF262
MDYQSSMEIITWFRDRYREGSLKIKPPYQRKPVWAARQKCYLIESILMALPVPEIYIQQTTQPDGTTTYAIVDGQQRIRTVLQFIGSETDPEQQEDNKFALDKLESTSAWRNLTFPELSDDDKRKFYGYKFAVRYLNTDSEDEVRDMFRRLNKFLTPLKPQELRNATYTGPFVMLVLKLADNEYWAENGIVTAAAIRRMGDVEYVSELLIGVMHGPQGGSAAVIDSYYAQYEDYEYEFPDQKRAEKLFDETLKAVQRVLPSIRDTRWGNKTDFYSLLVAFSSLLKTSDLRDSDLPRLRKALKDFGAEVDRRLSEQSTKVTREVIEYVRAVEKGANDKPRRAARHAALLKIIEPFFRSRGNKQSG